MSSTFFYLYFKQDFAYETWYFLVGKKYIFQSYKWKH